ncbi:helix-turn-helix transcriptional regulator [Streptomyces brasiliensis]|nr:LuxR family transcriptional regulator [Streptomyces brasiliensis]
MNDLDSTVCPASTRLVGRDGDLAFIQSFFGNSEVQGAALLLLGEVGVGKTAVLDVVAKGAMHNGVRVLRVAGVQFEADISYAGLNQLLVPLFEDFDVLDNPHRDALRVAVGIGIGPAPDRLLTSTAVLLLLRLISVRTPLLIVVDDLPWLDRATSAVLGFVARRLVGSRIGLLAAAREGAESFFASHARALAALGGGDYESAYQHARALSPPGTLAPYVPIAMWGTMDLVEAAVRTGRDKEAANHAAAMRASAMAELSPRLELLVLACEALTTSGEESAALFERALSLPGPERWPFDAARVRLFHGQRLRRLRATTEAREQLSLALEVFQRLGAKPWATRAAAELRASGQSAPTAPRPGAGALTAQELQIATLAATGLANKQIAERLFLSHRTIGTHLYQIYPKLGITSRAALRDALSGLDIDQDG